ncbi:MAG: hypothetical protein ABR985_22750 [Methanotrichaceae archaeon]
MEYLWSTSTLLILPRKHKASCCCSSASADYSAALNTRARVAANLSIIARFLCSNKPTA